MEVASPAGADLSGLPFSASLSILQIFAALLPVTFNLYALPFPSTRGSPNSAKSLRSLPCHNPSRLLCISLERDIARSDSTIPRRFPNESERSVAAVAALSSERRAEKWRNSTTERGQRETDRWLSRFRLDRSAKSPDEGRMAGLPESWQKYGWRACASGETLITRGTIITACFLCASANNGSGVRGEHARTSPGRQ